jgi:hypothetical protein
MPRLAMLRTLALTAGLAAYPAPALALRHPGETDAGRARSVAATTTAGSGSGWRTYDVRAFGAVGDGVHLDTPHIQAAIDAAVAAGGGIVLLPARGAAAAAAAAAAAPTYLSSGITLGSNIIFRIERGAVLGSSRRWSDYAYTMVLATDCAPGPCLEYRRHPIVLFSSCRKPVNAGRQNMRCDEWTRVSNVTLDGGGEIHGEGDAWWNSEKYMGQASQRPHILFPFYVNQLVVKDLTLRRSPWWTVHILACRDVVLSNIYIDAEVAFNSTVYPTDNVDGVDISSSQDVLIENSEIKPGDDCVVVYALHPNEMATRNITVRNVTCHTPFSIGNGADSKSSFLFFTDSFDEVTNDHLPRQARDKHEGFSKGGNVGFFAGDPGRMEFIEDILFENCTVRGQLTPNDVRFKPRWWQSALRVKGNPYANVRWAISRAAQMHRAQMHRVALRALRVWWRRRRTDVCLTCCDRPLYVTLSSETLRWSMLT